MGLSDYVGTRRQIPRLIDNGDNERKGLVAAADYAHVTVTDRVLLFIIFWKI